MKIILPVNCQAFAEDEDLLYQMILCIEANEPESIYEVIECLTDDRFDTEVELIAEHNRLLDLAANHCWLLEPIITDIYEQYVDEDDILDEVVVLGGDIILSYIRYDGFK